ncbi:glycosyltransferase [Luminiphilus sp.]|nr:glycosyltransferase [Luminiphilus sp.]
MKICHIVSGYHRTDARVFVRQCGSLVSAGYQVTLLTNDGLGDERVDKVDIVATGKSWPRWRTLLFARHQFGRHIKTVDADLYQLHSPELLPLVAQIKAEGKKVIYDAHEDMPAHILEKSWIGSLIRRPLSKIAHYYMNHVYKKIDGLVSPHHHVIDRAHAEVGKGTVVANFPKINWDDAGVDLLAVQREVFCYTGTVYDYSNQSLTIKAINALEDGKYEVAGVIGSEYFQLLESTVDLRRCKFHGHVSHADLRLLYKRSIAGLALYDYKLNLGWDKGSYGTNKIFEYMEAGIPIICTDYVLWKQIIDEYNCGFAISPGDIGALSVALNYLKDNPDMARGMGRNARRAVEARFNWRGEEVKYLGVIKEVLDE